MAEITTIEEARAEILRLQDQVTELTNERDTLSQNNADQAQELEKVRKLNQQYFNKLSQQHTPTPEDPEDEEPEIPSCEAFAKANYHLI